MRRNSVIFIDQIEKEKTQGRHPWDAVVEATAHRFRPILLTASLTLVFLPALYVTWFRIKRPQPDSIQKIELPQTAIAQPLT